MLLSMAASSGRGTAGAASAAAGTVVAGRPDALATARALA